MKDIHSPLTIRFRVRFIVDNDGQQFDTSSDEVRALLSVFTSSGGLAFLNRRNGVISDIETSSKESRFEMGFDHAVTVITTRKELTIDGNYDEDGVDVELKRLVGSGMNAWFSKRYPIHEARAYGDKFYSDRIPGIEFDGAGPYLVLKARLELDDYAQFLDAIEDDYKNRRNNLAQSAQWTLLYQFDSTNACRQPIKRFSKTTVFDYYPPISLQLRALNARALDLVRKIHEVDDAFSIPFDKIEERLSRVTD